MGAWESIAEARIREWLARPPEERATSHPGLDPGQPLEIQLWTDLRALDALADATADPEASETVRHRASDLMLRLMVLLESQGRPLAARHFAALRAGEGEQG